MLAPVSGVWLGARTWEAVVEQTCLLLMASPKAHGSLSLGCKHRRCSRSPEMAHSHT